MSQLISSRFSELDAIRGLAAISVVLYHYTSRYLKLYPKEFSDYFHFKYGDLGVEAFFILSGFVIYFSLLKLSNPFVFLVKRFIRLYPTYWICLIFSFFITNYFRLEGKMTNLFELLVNFSMLQFGLQVRSVDGVYWSLFYELLFYFLIAISFYFIKNGRFQLFAFFWIVLYLFNFFFHMKYVTVLFNLTYAPLFLSGIFFYKIKMEKFNFFNFIAPFILFICYSISIADFNIIILIGFIYCIFYLFSFNLLYWIKLKPLMFLGYISYPLYLIHQNFGYVILNFLYENFGSYQIFILIPLSLSILLSFLITKYFDDFSIKFWNRKFENSKLFLTLNKF